MLNLKKYITLVALGLAGGVMYVYPYIRYVFHIPLMETLHISNQEVGLLLTIYGIVSCALYIPGGILTDRIRAKKPLLLSMLWAFVLIFGFALVLTLVTPVPYWVAILVWALMPFATTFVFWNSLVKAIGMAGDDNEQGRCFGIYFAANAIFGTIISSTNMFAYTQMGFKGVTFSVAAFVLIAMLAILILFKERNLKEVPKISFTRNELKQVLTNKKVWIAGIIMMLIYMMFTCTTYFTPFMTTVCGLNNEISGALGVFRTYFIMIFAAIFSGIIADKVFHSTLKWFRVSGLCMIASTTLFIITGFNTSPIVVAIVSVLPAIFSTMIYAIQFSTISELKLPKTVMGTASGLASMIVFSPDIYFDNILGSILDNNTPEIGYLIIFCLLIAICLVIVILASVLLKLNKH